MTREQQYLAHLMFKNKVFESDGNAFECFFTKVMSCHNANFQQVKPQGRIGDRKNDGFDKTTGTYYQVYAPEEIGKKETNAISKLKEDFNGLYSYWQKLCPIHHFFYVINDKFKGGFPSIYAELSKIHNEHPDVETGLFLAKDLENICLNLSDEDIDACLGYVPEIESIDVDYEVLNEVISYLLSVKVDLSAEFIPTNPDFDKKISFNGLSETIGHYLRSHRINEHYVEDFFSLNGTYTKDTLRGIFNGLYNKASSSIEDAEDKPDQVFTYILQNSCKRHDFALDNAILTLMSYYFEYCDIFQAPAE